MKQLAGVFPTIPTPFTPKEEINEEVLRNLVESLVRDGIDGILPVGSMGEGTSLDERERQRVVEICFDQVRGRVKIIIGSTAQTTRKAKQYVQEAAQFDAEAVMIAPPYYGFPTDAEIERHYREIAQSSSLPIIIYNNPYKTGGNIPPPLLAKLAEKEENLRYWKDSSSDVTRVSQVLAMTDRMTVFCGTDNLVLETYLAGGKGLMTAIAVVAPRLCVELHKHALAKEWEQARLINERLRPLGNFFETGRFTAYAKAAMEAAGLRVGPVRLPTLPLDENEQALLRSAMRSLSGAIPPSTKE